MADVSFVILTDLTDDPVIASRVKNPVGDLEFMAEPVLQGNVLVLLKAHVQGGKPGLIGHTNLGVIAQALLEGMGFDELIVEGALRTTGAKPGRAPRPVRYQRKIRPLPP